MKSLMLWGIPPPYREEQPIGAVQTAVSAGLSASAYFILVLLHFNKNIWYKDVKQTMKPNEGAASLFLSEGMEVGRVESIYNMHATPNGRPRTQSRYKCQHRSITCCYGQPVFILRAIKHFFTQYLSYVQSSAAWLETL